MTGFYLKFLFACCSQVKLLILQPFATPSFELVRFIQMCITSKHCLPVTCYRSVTARENSTLCSCLYFFIIICLSSNCLFNRHLSFLCGTLCTKFLRMENLFPMVPCLVNYPHSWLTALLCTVSTEAYMIHSRSGQPIFLLKYSAQLYTFFVLLINQT